MHIKVGYLDFPNSQIIHILKNIRDKLLQLMSKFSLSCNSTNKMVLSKRYTINNEKIVFIRMSIFITPFIAFIISIFSKCNDEQKIITTLLTVVCNLYKVKKLFISANDINNDKYYKPYILINYLIDF